MRQEISGTRVFFKHAIFRKNERPLKAKIQIENLRILAGIGLKPTITLGTWQSGASPGTPRAGNLFDNPKDHVFQRPSHCVPHVVGLPLQGVPIAYGSVAGFWASVSSLLLLLGIRPAKKSRAGPR
jgi:hypothetical protein